MNSYNLPESKLWKERNRYIDLCIIRDSGDIRRLFFDRCKELKVNPVSVAMSCGVRPAIFKDCYIDPENPIYSKNFTQEKFLKILQTIGINVRITVVVIPIDKIDTTKIYVKKRQPMKIRTLISDPIDEEICLNSLVKELANCSKPLSQLEVKNTVDALRNSKKALAEFKKRFIEFESRIKVQVTKEVMEERSRQGKSKSGNAEYFKGKM